MIVFPIVNHAARSRSCSFYRMTDEDQRALAVKTVAAVFLSVACVSVILRCYVRGWVVKGFGWDDGSMILAMVGLQSQSTRNRQAHKQAFYAMFSGCMIGGTLYGTGRKFEHLDAFQRVTAMQVYSYSRSLIMA